MKYTFSFILFFSILISRSQTIKTEKDIVIGRLDSVYSDILKEKRKIWVYVPQQRDTITLAIEHYPVAYVLDGEAHFFSIMSMIYHMSEVSGNNLCPKMIVVGILNTDRTRDLTPTHMSGGPYVDSDFVKTSGGGEKFTEFIEKELFPFVQSKYPTAPYRTLIGHSFGGLLAVNILINHNELFNSYVAIDPSMWWDNQKLLNHAKIKLQQNKFNNKTLYLAKANTMQFSTDTSNLKNELPNTGINMRAGFKFAESLKVNKDNGLRWQYKYYNDDTHGSVPFIAEYDALRFIFDFYKCSFLNKLTDVNFKGDSAISAHYKNISKRMGYTIYPSEALINTIGCNFVSAKQLDKAYPFLKMNVENYPTSFNTFDSFAWYYEEKGDKEKAVEYYTKALKIKDWPETRKSLKRVTEKK